MKVYRNMAGRIASALFLAGAFMLVSAARSEAALIVYICDEVNCTGGPNITVTDNGVGDSSALAGVINIAVGTYPGSISATTKPTVGNPNAPYLNLTYSLGDAAFGLFPTPYIFATENGFLNFPGTASMTANASFGSGTAAFFSGTGTFTPPGVPSFTCAMPCTQTAALVGPSPYYLAVRVAPVPTIIGDQRAASGDATATVVPDGGSTAALLGSVLVGFGLLRRRFNV